ncbi:MAG: trypsin-like peptidase domain-containing protein [Saprospiraceae bacterium]
MKTWLSILSAGLIGGAVALGGSQWMNQKDNNINNPESQKIQAVQVSSRAAIGELNFTAAAEIAMPAVVHIRSIESKQMAQQRYKQQLQRSPFSWFMNEDDQFYGYEPLRKEGTGSGVIIDPNGYIVTNNHVVEFADEFEVTLYDKRKVKAKIVGRDPKTDIAVLKIDEPNLAVMPLGDSDAARVGEWVLAVGNPFNLSSTVTAGIISAKERKIDINAGRGTDAIEAFIQTDAAVNPGNSGGALVDLNGKLIGINSAIATPTGVFAGYSFAIPTNFAMKIVNDIIEYGSFQRAYLGVEMVDLGELERQDREELGVNINQGAYVYKLAEGGSAQYAGLLPNDVIVGIDGKNVRSVPELQEWIGRAKVGDVVKLSISRGGTIREIPVKLKPGT